MYQTEWGKMSIQWGMGTLDEAVDSVIINENRVNNICLKLSWSKCKALLRWQQTKKVWTNTEYSYKQSVQAKLHLLST